MCAHWSSAYANEKPNIVVTTGMIADAVSNIAEDHVNIKVLMGSGVDPHAYRQTRSDIVSLASQRAKDILDGSEPKLDYDGKPSVIALKEIAEGLIDMSYFDTRRKQQIEDQLSDAIAEEEAIADITAESQQIIQDDSARNNDSHDDSETMPEETSSQSPENTEDKLV